MDWRTKCYEHLKNAQHKTDMKNGNIKLQTLSQGDHSPYQIKLPDFSSGAGNISSIRSFNGSQFFHINYNRPATVYHYFSSNG